MKVAAIIPALNEGPNIGAVVSELVELVDEVVVADNGSTDDTAGQATAAGAFVVHEARKGYGSACAAASAAATDRGADVLVYLDADGSSLPAEIQRVLDPVLDGSASLVLGSRTLGNIEAGAMGPHQRFGNAIAAALMRRLYDVAVTDLGPYRAIRSDVLAELDMTEMTFGWPTEMTVKVAKRGGTIVEVPVTWQARTQGDSKVSGTLKGSIVAGWQILSITVRHSR